jgi:hypothetical protein
MMNKLQSALSGVESTLAKKDRVRQGIAVQVQKLTSMLCALEESRRALEDVMAAEAIDEAGAGDVAKAKKRVAGIQNEIASVSETLAGLRRSMAKLGPQLAEEHRKLSAEMPAYHATMKADFIREYTAAAEKFAQVVGKKQAIEALIQERLDLPTPAPIAVDLGEPAKPDTRLREAAAAIGLIGSSAPMDLLIPGPHRHYYPDRIYQLVRDFADPSGVNLPAGTLVIAASLEANWLAALVRVGDAVLPDDPAWQASSDAARSVEMQRSRIASEALHQAVSPLYRVQ